MFQSIPQEFVPTNENVIYEFMCWHEDRYVGYTSQMIVEKSRTAMPGLLKSEYAL